MAKEKEMSFLQHLEELRWHLVRALIAVMVGATLAFIFPEILFDKILFGPSHPDFITYTWLCRLGDTLGMKSLCISALPFENFLNIKMSAQFTWYIWGSLIAGFIIAFPYVIWEIWRFVKPALHTNEKKGATGLVFYISLLFLLGVSFGYFLLTPLTLNFLGNFSVMSKVESKFLFTDYISTVLNVTLGCGIVFELPVLIYFLAKIGLVSPKFLKRYRRHAIVIILILAAIITPPDVASQLLVALPLYILYEIGIVIAKRVYKET